MHISFGRVPDDLVVHTVGDRDNTRSAVTEVKINKVQAGHYRNGEISRPEPWPQRDRWGAEVGVARRPTGALWVTAGRRARW